MNTSYSVSADQVNNYNISLSNLANARLLEAQTILDSCKNISFSAYLTNSASVVYSKRILDTQDIIVRGTIPPDISLNDTLGLEENSQTISAIDASANLILQTQLANTNTQLLTTITLLNTTQLLTNTISKKAMLTESLNTLLKYIAKSFSDSLFLLLNNKNNILSRDILNSNDIPSYTLYLPTVPVKNSLMACNKCIAIVNAFISSIVNNTGDANIITLIQEVVNISNGLDNTARNNDITAYNYANTANLTPVKINIEISSIMTPVAIASDKSASNFRYISNSLVSIKSIYNNLVTIDTSIQEIFTNTLNSLNNILTLVNPVITNTSNASANLINIKGYNRITCELQKKTDLESSLVSYSKEITLIYDLVTSSKNIALTTISTDTNSTQKLLWSANSITAEAQTQFDNAQSKAFLLINNISTPVTSHSIKFQTLYSTNAAISMANEISRHDRQSNTPPFTPPITRPIPFRARFRAGIPFISRNRPEDRPENYVYRKPGEKFNLSSINSPSELLIQITKRTQEIKDNSILLSKK